MAAATLTLHRMTRIANLLRALADALDPPMPSPPRMGVPPGTYFLDFTRGEVWLDGELISRSQGPN